MPEERMCLSEIRKLDSRSVQIRALQNYLNHLQGVDTKATRRAKRLLTSLTTKVPVKEQEAVAAVAPQRVKKNRNKSDEKLAREQKRSRKARKRNRKAQS